MNGTRQKIQYSLALEPVDQGETPVSGYQGTEPFMAKPISESQAVTEQLMEEMCDRENLVRAWKRVRRNKGSPGVDGMTIATTPGITCVSTGQAFGPSCSREPTSRSRSSG
jgi:RNA-directed DNA polymerase